MALTSPISRSNDLIAVNQASQRTTPWPNRRNSPLNSVFVVRAPPGRVPKARTGLWPHVPVTANCRPARGATPPLKGVDQGLGPKLSSSDAFLPFEGLRVVGCRHK